MKETLILGRDVFIKHKCIINYSNLTFQIKGISLPLLKINNSGKKKSTLSVRCNRTYIVPENSEVFIPCSLFSGAKRMKVYLTISGIIEPIQSVCAKKNHIESTNTLSNFLKGKGFYRLVNPNDYKITIYKNQKLGNFSSFNKSSVYHNNNCEFTPIEHPATGRHAWKTDIEQLYQKLGLHLLTHLTEKELTQVKALVYEYKNIFSESDDDIGSTDIGTHTIHLDTKVPIRAKYRPLPLAHKEPAEREIKRLMDLKIIEPSNSPYHSPAFLIRRPKGWRLIVDYREINKHIIRSYQPLPSIESVTSQWNNCKFFSRLDFNQGYYNIKLSEESKPITACSVPGCSFFQFNRVPLGLSSAVGFFQNLIEKLLMGLKNSRCVAYMDDIGTASQTFIEMMENLKSIFERILSSGLLLKPQKCRLFQQEMDFLGLKLSQKGISVNPEKTEAISKMLPPRNRKGVKSFLGMTGFFRKFVKGYAELSRPLTDLLKKENKFTWGNSQDKAFRTLKEKLISPPILKFPDINKEFFLTTDASLYCIGSVLSQYDDDGHLHPVAFASNILTKPQQNWSSFQREFYALKFYCEKFRHYLLHKKFTVRTDHQALVHWQQFKSIENPKLWRWFMTLSQFDFVVEHIPGKANEGDGPSRLPRFDDPNIHTLPESAEVAIDKKFDINTATDSDKINIQPEHIFKAPISQEVVLPEVAKTKNGP